MVRIPASNAEGRGSIPFHGRVFVPIRSVHNNVYVHPQNVVFRAAESFSRTACFVRKTRRFLFFSAPLTNDNIRGDEPRGSGTAISRSFASPFGPYVVFAHAVASSIFSAARRERGIFTRRRRADDSRNDAHASESSDVRHTTPRGRPRGDDAPKKHQRLPKMLIAVTLDHRYA